MPRLALLSLMLLLTAAAVAQPVLTFTPIATGLAAPVAITHAGDTRLFITLQGGRVLIFDGTQLLPTPFLDITPLVTSGGERGLLSVAFHPRYAENGFLFVNYTDTRGDTVVARYQVSANDPNRVDPASARQVLVIDQPYANHNGGQLQFGPDGYLYIGMGDGGSGGDPQGNGQSLDTLLGKMLRIDVDQLPYAVPSSNPYAGGGALPEIWASGLRNPWRFTFDRMTGDLWIADVGQGSWEEVNFQPATSIGGENYGWRVMEGTHCFGAAQCDRTGLTLPVIEYGHGGGACSVTGGYVYRGSRWGRMRGLYFYGDFCTGQIRGARRDANGVVTTSLLADTGFFISSFGEDVTGELYVADLNGAVYRIGDQPPRLRRRAVRR